MFITSPCRRVYSDGKTFETAFYPIINTKKNENRTGEGEDLEKMY